MKLSGKRTGDFIKSFKCLAKYLIYFSYGNLFLFIFNPNFQRLNSYLVFFIFDIKKFFKGAVIRMKAFITVIGEDKVGIIYGVTGVLKEANVNVLDITQTLLDNYFTMIMFVDLTNMQVDFKELKKALSDVESKLGVSIKIQHKDIFDSMHTI